MSSVVSQSAATYLYYPALRQSMAKLICLENGQLFVTKQDEAVTVFPLLCGFNVPIND